MQITKTARTFLFLSLLFCCRLAVGQGVDSLRLEMLAVTSGIDLGQATSGIVLDMGRPFANLTKYDGTIRQNQPCNYHTFENVYNSLADAQIANRSIPEFSQVYGALEAATDKNGHIALGVVSGRYHRFSPDVLTAGKLAWQTDHYVVGPNGGNPFLEVPVLAAAFSREYLKTGITYTLALPAAAKVAVGGASVGTIQINFGDGRGNQTIAPGAPLTIAFADTGMHRIKIKASVGSSQDLETEVEVYLKEGSSINPPSVTDWTQAPDRIVEIPATSTHAGCKLEIGFAVGNRPGAANPNSLIRNPLLVVEGIDYHDVAPHLVTYEYDYLRVMEDLGDWENLQGLSFPPHNRDLIVLNFNNSTESIVRNAALFKDVIAWLNDPANRVAGMNIASSKTAVVGISMGGLVARLGLAQMVAANQDVDNTNVSLLFTQDSPHSGAYLPMSIQVMARTLILGGTAALVGVGLSGSISSKALAYFGYTYIYELHSLIECDAADNMLLAKYKYTSFVFGAEFNNPWLQWYKDQVNNVPGAQYRFVATSVGSECAQPQKMVSGRVQFELSITAIAELDFGEFRLFSVGAGGIFQLQGMPAENTGGKYVELKIWERMEVLGFGNWSLISINHSILDLNASVAGNDGHHAWDFAPGGYSSLMTKGYNAGFNFNVGLFGINLFRFGVTSKRAKGFCFIPTASALNQNVYSDASLFTARNYLYNSPVNGPGNARLANFSSEPPSGTDNNFQHPFFKARSARLLFAEVTGSAYNEAACGITCTPGAIISGPLVICEAPGLTIQESISDAYSSGNIEWVVTNGVIESGYGTTQITISAPNPVGSKIAVDVTITMPNGCVIVGHKDLHIGAPKNPIQIVSSTFLARGGRKFNLKPTLGSSLTVDLAPGSNPINCDIDAIFSPANVLQIVCGFNSNACNSNTYLLKESNTCGDVYEEFSAQCTSNKIAIVPQSPVKGIDFTVEVSSYNSGINFPANGVVEDRRGKVVLRFTANNAIFNLDIHKLQAASYLLRLDPDGANDQIEFIVRNSANEKLSLSPNPAFKGIDNEVEVVLVDDTLGNDSIAWQLEDFGGSTLQTWTGNAITRFSLTGLQPATYVIRATYGGNSVQQDIDFLLKGTPFISLSPNPTSDIVHVSLLNPVYPNDDVDNTHYQSQLVELAEQIPIVNGLDYVVSNGINDVASGTSFSDQFDIDMTSFPSGIYTISVTDGLGQYAKHLQVIH